jgi:hypothetical protein
MRNVTLTREQGDDSQGTFGSWVSDSGVCVKSLELPWKDDKPGISCIPLGTYNVRWLFSPKHGWCFHVQDVPGRSYVEIHSCNLAGDTELGYVSQLSGCISVGFSKYLFRAEDGYPAGNKDQLGVLESHPALTMIQNDLGVADFQLTIKRGAM